MQITEILFPAICLAFKDVDLTNATDQYESNQIYSIPREYVHLLAPAEKGLARLLAENEDLFYEFVEPDVDENGNSVSEDLRKARGDLDEAARLIGLYFQDWYE